MSVTADLPKAEIKDNHLYIRYEVYYEYSGLTTKTKIIPLKDIKYIEAKVGKRGGMHLWYLCGYHPEYSELEYNKDEKFDQHLHTGDRKDTDLLDKIREVLPNVKYIEEVEGGGAPW